MAENKINFTKTLLENLPLPPPGTRASYFDIRTPGLNLRVTSSGVMSFSVFRRVNGKPERVTIGKFPEMTIEQARRHAATINAVIAKGDSPSAERKRKKLEAKSLREVFEDYISTRSLKPLTIFDIHRCMNEVFGDWLDKPLTKIDGEMVTQRHKRYGEEHSEARANLAMRYLRAVFNFAMAKYEDQEGNAIVSINPVKKLSTTKAWHRVERRQTVIREHELKAWVGAVTGLDNVDMSDYFMVLLLTGLRRQEALNLTWADVDLNGKTLTIRDPKNRHDHCLPLSAFLHSLFTRRKAAAVSERVFAGRDGRCISNFRYALSAIEKASGVKATAHDLRRTFATIAESLDIPGYALKRLLNHATGNDVTAGYIVPNPERLREPMQKITNFVLKNAGMVPTAEIIPMNRSRA